MWSVSSGTAFVPDKWSQMSGIGRVRQTRLKLERAFNKLVLERGYAKLTVGDVIKEAGVGRSTFYEHFETKDDIFRQSLKPLLSALASSLGEPKPTEQLLDIIRHFWENRRLTHRTFGGETRPLVSGFLSDVLQERLAIVARRSRASKPLVPARLLAAHLAEGQLGLIDAWATGKAACSAEALAQLIHDSANASATLWATRTPHPAR